MHEEKTKSPTKQTQVEDVGIYHISHNVFH